MSSPDTFDERDAGGLWSDAANWSDGVPVDGSSVDDADSTVSVDDLSSLSLTSLSLSGGAAVEVTDGTLTVDTVEGAATAELIAEGGLNPATTEPVTITVGSITGTGGTYGASGAKSVFIDNSSTDTGNYYYATAGGKFVLGAAPTANSYLSYDNTGTPSTIALKDPGAVTSTPIENLSNGDVLELPGSSVTSVTYGSNSLNVTTSAGSYTFNDVNYDTQNGKLNGYTATVDASTGLEAITFTAPDVFDEADAGGLWSDAANWSDGVPIDGSSVADTNSTTSNDDLSSLSLTSLLLSGGANVDVTDGTLTVGSVAGNSTVTLLAEGGLNPATTVPVTITVGSITGTGGNYGAVGAKSVFIDNSSTDTGNFYAAVAGGKFVLGAAPSANSYLAYDETGAPSTIALKNPGAVTNTPLNFVSNGDVLELPGSSVSSVTYGSNSLNITTSAGSFTFSNVTYDTQNGQLNGYTASFDAGTGLEAITFTAPDVFSGINGELWSTAANWSSGVPANGESVQVSNESTDDLSSLSLSSLVQTSGADTGVRQGTLTIGTVQSSGGGQLEAQGGLNPATTVAVTVTVGKITGTGTYGASGAKSEFIDNSSADPGNTFFYADAGGTVEIASRVASSSMLDYLEQPGSVGTFALENPGELIAAKLEGVSAGDVLELPGTSVSSVVIGSNYLNITTSAGEYVFNNVDYADGPVQGYTASFDARTGLEAITFNTPDVFTAANGQLWSTSANWSNGVPPTGASVDVSGQSTDDLSSSSLASLTDTSTSGGAVTDVTHGTLTIGSVNERSGGKLEADGGINAATVTVGALTGTGSYGASGAKSLFIDNAAADPGNTLFLADSGGTVEIASQAAASSTLDYDGAVGSPGTFALKNPGELTSAKLEGLSAGDTLELPGTSVSSVVIGSNYLNITTSAGEFVFNNVAYSGALVDGYTESFDATTGLEAITFTAPDTFDEADAGGLWSDAANWSDGVPIDGSSVADADSTTSVDDLSGLSLASLSLSEGATVDVTDGTLTVGTVDGNSTVELLAEGGLNPATTVPVTITVGSITGTGGNYGAVGAKSVFIDNSSTDTGNYYAAVAGGKFVLGAAPSANSYLAYDGTGAPSTIALKNPGAVTSTPLNFVSNGDVLELPGSSVSSVTYGSNSLNITTSAGSFTFSNVTYDTQNGQLNGYTASFDAGTGLEAITFTAPDKFSSMNGQLWSTAANWSNGVPANGESVQVATLRA